MVITFALPGTNSADRLRFLIRRPADGHLYDTAKRRMLPPREDDVRAWGTVLELGYHAGRTEAEGCFIYGAAVGENSFEPGDYELVVSARNIVTLQLAFRAGSRGFQHGGPVGAIGDLPADDAGDSIGRRRPHQRGRIVE